MKTFKIALGMTVALFLYGYFLSTAGHDHSHHQGKGGEGVSVKPELDQAHTSEVHHGQEAQQHNH